jgi:glycine/serine hydroxymethyltransferase
MGTSEMATIAGLIDDVISDPNNASLKKRVNAAVVELNRNFPLYPELG